MPLIVGLAAPDRGQLADEGLEVLAALRVGLERRRVEPAAFLLASLDLLVGELSLVATDARARRTGR